MNQITETTQNIGLGPFTLDCEQARRGGYSEAQIQRAADRLATLARHENGVAQRRHPELYVREHGEIVFCGPPFNDRAKMLRRKGVTPL